MTFAGVAAGSEAFALFTGIRSAQHPVTDSGVETARTRKIAWPVCSQGVAAWHAPPRCLQITDLRAATSYVFRVRACVVPAHDAPHTPPPEPMPSPALVFSTLPALPGPPHPPAVLSYAADALRLRWAEPDDTGGGPVLGYRLSSRRPPHRAPAPGCTLTAEWRVIYEGPAHEVAVPQLQPAQPYEFQLQVRALVLLCRAAGSAPPARRGAVRATRKVRKRQVRRASRQARDGLPRFRPCTAPQPGDQLSCVAGRKRRGGRGAEPHDRAQHELRAARPVPAPAPNAAFAHCGAAGVGRRGRPRRRAHGLHGRDGGGAQRLARGGRVFRHRRRDHGAAARPAVPLPRARRERGASRNAAQRIA